MRNGWGSGEIWRGSDRIECFYGPTGNSHPNSPYSILGDGSGQGWMRLAGLQKDLAESWEPYAVAGIDAMAAVALRYR